MQVFEIGFAWPDPLAQSGLWSQRYPGEWGGARADQGYEDAAGKSGGVGEE